MLALLLASLALAEGEASPPTGPFAAASYLTEIQPLAIPEATAAIRPHRARVAALKETEHWCRGGREAEIALPEGMSALGRVDHLLSGPLRVQEASTAVASHVARDRYGSGSWRYEQWRSSYRTPLEAPPDAFDSAAVVSEALFWVKDVYNERGTWEVAADVLVTWRGDHLATVYEYVVDDGIVTERVIDVDRDEAGRIRGLTITEVMRGDYLENGVVASRSVVRAEG